jgi:cell division protein FtsN
MQPQSDQPNHFEPGEAPVRNEDLLQPAEQQYLDPPPRVDEGSALGPYAVQIGAFRREDGARRRLLELQEQGYEVRLVSSENDGNVTFRLLMGDFRSYDEASRNADRLKVAGIDAFVRTTG